MLLVRHRVIPLVAVTLLALGGAPAQAQWRDSWGGNAYTEGYNDGARAGRDDARDGRAFEYQRHRDYRENNRGNGSRGDRNTYVQQYRSGFVAGYRDGYYGGGGRGRGVIPRGGRPSYGGGPNYGDSRYGGYPGRGADVAYTRGRDEGYRKGLEDGRDRDPRDPWRHGWYRDGDRGYRREFGPRGLYQRSYRAAFEQGYAQGYRDGRQRGGGGIWRW
jgi:hypothetical protein